MNTEPLLVRPGQAALIAERDTRDTLGLRKRPHAREHLDTDIEQLTKLQEVFAAARTHALLIVLQGMDSAGKDGAIKHVMSGVNPQGVDVVGFKEPTPEELLHDFLWRCMRFLPERGRIGIFNRSYYEEVIVVRVHERLLAAESIAPANGIWQQRFEDINGFERHLARNGTVVLKFFLHLSKAEQRKRLLARLDDSDKNWKFSANDVRERGYWEHYQQAYEAMLTATSTAEAPWYVIPADRKWFVRTAIANILVAKLASLDLHYPRVSGDAAKTLAQFKAELEAE